MIHTVVKCFVTWNRAHFKTGSNGARAFSCLTNEFFSKWCTFVLKISTQIISQSYFNPSSNRPSKVPLNSCAMFSFIILFENSICVQSSLWCKLNEFVLFKQICTPYFQSTLFSFAPSLRMWSELYYDTRMGVL